MEDRPKDVIERDKGRCHTATGAQKLTTVHPELAGVGLGEIFEPLLELSLPFCLWQRIELPVRHHSRRNGRFEVQSFRQLGLCELPLAQEDTHGFSSFGYAFDDVSA